MVECSRGHPSWLARSPTAQPALNRSKVCSEFDSCLASCRSMNKPFGDEGVWLSVCPFAALRTPLGIDSIWRIARIARIVQIEWIETGGKGRSYRCETTAIRTTSLAALWSDRLGPGIFAI